MRVLVACEHSGVVREAFRAQGHYALSCDILPATDGSPFHHQGDVKEILGMNWDLMVAHPPCTYLCSSGIHWNNKRPGRDLKTEAALEFVRLLLSAPIPRIALENPIGVISTRIRKPNQIIQPYQFGHDRSKATCYWLKGLPLLEPTKYIPPRETEYGPRWANQTDKGGRDTTPKSPMRGHIRSITDVGIAQAMAQQWGNHVSLENYDSQVLEVLE